MAACTDCKGLGYRLRELEQGGGPEVLKKIDIGFTAQDWRGLDFINVIADGIPGFNEIGPHLLPAGTYNIQVYRYIDMLLAKEVNVVIIVDRVTGLITMFKSSRVSSFSGRIVIDYASSG